MPIFPCSHSEHQQVTIPEVFEIQIIFIQDVTSLDIFEEESEEDGQNEIE